MFFNNNNNKPFSKKTKGDRLNFSSWTPFAKKDEYLKGYFDFPSYQFKSDSDVKRIRTFTMLGLMESIVNRGNVKNFAECGCYLGQSSYAISKFLLKNNFKEKFHIFDSFEGLSDPVDNDLNSVASNINSNTLNKLFKGKERMFKGNYNNYISLMNDFEFIKVYKGWIPERFNEVSKLEFSFVHIDVDIYQPTLDSVKFFYPRLEKGGVIYIDDYGRPYWPGCDKAIHEFLSTVNSNEYLFLKVPMGGAAIIKI